MTWQQFCILIGVEAILLGFAWHWFASSLQSIRLKRVKSRVDSPPQGLTPAEAEYLISDKLSVRAIAATLLDLQNRGLLSISQNSKDFGLHLRNPRKPTNSFEKKLIMFIFSGKLNKRTLSSIHPDTTPRLMEQLSSILRAELVQEKVYRQLPPIYKRGSVLIGFVVIVLAVLALVGLNYVLPGSFAVVFAVGGLVGGWLLSRRGRLSQAGLHELEQLQAFKQYLVQTTKLSDHTLYYKYLPFAVAMDVDKQWSDRFGAAEINDFMQTVARSFITTN